MEIHGRMVLLSSVFKKKSGGRYLKKEPVHAKKNAATAALIDIGYWLFTFSYLELILHLVAFDTLGMSFALVLCFSVLFAAIPALLLSFLPRKVHYILTLVLTLVLVLLYGSQAVYFFVFGSLYSVSQMKMGGDAITSFWRETLSTMAEHFPWLLALLVPLVIAVLLWTLCKKAFAPSRAFWRILLVILAIVTQVGAILALNLGGTGYFSNHYFYHGDSTTTDQAASRFGLMTAFRLDIFGSGQESAEDDTDYYIPTTTAPKETAPQIESTAPDVTESNVEEETIPETEPKYMGETGTNIFTIDFDALNSLSKDKKITALNNYCASLPGTSKNQYTGLLSDYNLILICGESFSTAAIDPELTPTLYRMANEGIIFNNFYNSFDSNTIDGEYALCMGLWPDTTRNKNENSFLASRLCYLPFCLGNAFQEQLGIQSYGYHNNNRDYYSRGASHPNIGYKMKFAGSGMKFSSSAWPKSDLEMVTQTTDDYLHAGQFHAYYMTFSGHMKYNVNVNNIAAKNYDEVAHLTYSEEAKCYLSCNIELEKSLQYLMEQLEADGVADKTAIVLVGDHYPYGLTNEQYSELVGYTVDEFTKNKSSLLFWVGGLDENIVVDEYCCNVDVLPTILNLWGLDYDSRLLAGTDVFSDGEHIAIRVDKSFYTDKVWLNANTGEVRYLVDESELPEGYVENLIKLVQTKFSTSADILNKSYYKFIFETGKDAVIRQDPTQEN